MPHPLSILVADDDPDMRAYLAHGLGQAVRPRPEVVEAPDGRAALEILEDRAIDLVVSDVRMPRLDGLSLCRALDDHASLETTPVLLITGETDLIGEVRAYVATHARRAILRKPFNTDTLQNAVEALLRDCDVSTTDDA